VDNASPSDAFSMIRLQRRLLRSDAVSVAAGTPGDASFRGLILTLAFGAIAAGAAACVESGVGGAPGVG